MPQSKETLSAAVKNAAESTERKQQVSAGPGSNTDAASKSNSKVSCATRPASSIKTSTMNSAVETVKILTGSDATGKTEVNEYIYYILPGI